MGSHAVQGPQQQQQHLVAGSTVRLSVTTRVSTFYRPTRCILSRGIVGTSCSSRAWRPLQPTRVAVLVDSTDDENNVIQSKRMTAQMHALATRFKVQIETQRLQVFINAV